MRLFTSQELPQLSKKVLRIASVGSKRNNTFIRLLDLANAPDADEDAVDDFAKEILRVMGFCDEPRDLVIQKNLALFVCGELCHAKIDIGVIDSSTRHFDLGEEDKTRKNRDGLPKHIAQLTAAGLAIFYQNNIYREMRGLPRLTEMVSCFVCMLALC